MFNKLMVKPKNRVNELRCVGGKVAAINGIEKTIPGTPKD
jgi:hypothetical protein